MRRLPLIIRRNRYRRLVPVVRALTARGWPPAAVGHRLGMSAARVRRALEVGSGIWSPGEVARMRAALVAESLRAA